MPLDALLANPVQLAAAISGGVLLLGLTIVLLLLPRASQRSALQGRIQALASGTNQASRAAAASARGAARKGKLVQSNLKEVAGGGKQKQRRIRLRQVIVQAGLTWSMATFYTFSFACGAFAAMGYWLVSLPLWGLPFAAVVGFVTLPRFFLKRLASKRQHKFATQLADAIDIIVRGIRSGLPVGECLNIIARESSEPIGGEFKQIVEGQRLGMTLKEVLEKAVERVPIADLRFFAVVLVLQQKTGGNLAEALSNLSGILRARKKMSQKVKAMSSEARMTAAIIGSLPFILSGLIYLINPGYIGLLFVDPIGKKLVVGGAVWMGIGIFVMKKMISFKI
jgi:tight adherence protein B